MSDETRTTLDILLATAVKRIHDYVVIGGEAADACALWAAHSHAVEAFRITPYIHVSSATKQAGKSRLLEVLRPLCARPVDTDGMTPAALIRTMDSERPTLLLDEVDAAFGGSKEMGEALRGILNSGFRSRGNFRKVVGEGSNMIVRSYSTFGAKCLAGIGTLPPTVADRSIPIRLRRRAPGERVKEFYEEEWEDEALTVARGFSDALTAKLEDLARARPERPEGISDRAKDAWTALLAIADVAGGDWPGRARHAAQVLCGSVELDEQEIGVRMLGALRDAFDVLGDELRSTEFRSWLHEQSDEPWADWSRGTGISARKVADLLRPFDIKPRQIWIGNSNVRGYERRRCEDAFLRYLPPEGGENARTARSALASQKQGDGEPLEAPQSSGPENASKGLEQANLAVLAVPDEAKGRDRSLVPPYDDSEDGW